MGVTHSALRSREVGGGDRCIAGGKISAPAVRRVRPDRNHRNRAPRGRHRSWPAPDCEARAGNRRDTVTGEDLLEALRQGTQFRTQHGGRAMSPPRGRGRPDLDAVGGVRYHRRVDVGERQSAESVHAKPASRAPRPVRSWRTDCAWESWRRCADGRAMTRGRGQAARGAAAGVQSVQTRVVGFPHQREQIAARPAHVRFDETQHRIGAECGIDGTAAGLEQFDGDLRREALTGGRRAVARHDGRTGASGRLPVETDGAADKGRTRHAVMHGRDLGQALQG